MLRWTGSAELLFEGSARLAFAKALEEAQTDVDREHPEAWVVDDRTISFSVTSETTLAVLDAYKRLLRGLLDRATSGEAVIEVDKPGERWAHAIVRDGVQSVSGAVRVDADEAADALETIRTSAG